MAIQDVNFRATAQWLQCVHKPQQIEATAVITTRVRLGPHIALSWIALIGLQGLSRGLARFSGGPAETKRAL